MAEPSRRVMDGKDWDGYQGDSAGESAKQYVPSGIKKSHVKFDDVSQNGRVLVAVPAGKDGQITHYYCPAKSVLVAQGN